MSTVYTVAEIARITGYTKVRIHQLIRELNVPTERHIGTVIITKENAKKHFRRKNGAKI